MATPEVEAAEKLWLKVQEQTIVTSQARVIDGGKQVITLSTVLSGAYFTALSFANLATVDSWLLRAIVVLPVLLWSLGIVAAIRIVVPVKEYATDVGNPLSGKLLFVNIVLEKVVWLRVGLWLQVWGIVVMLIVLWLRLAGMAPLAGKG